MDYLRNHRVYNAANRSLHESVNEIPSKNREFPKEISNESNSAIK